MGILLAVAVVLAFANGHGSEMVVFELDQSHLTEAPTREVNKISNFKCAKKCNTRENCTYFFYNHYTQTCMYDSWPQDVDDWSLYRKKECPEGWTMFGYSCYIVVNNASTWQDSSNSCNALGGYLLEIGTGAEQKVIDRLVKGYDHDHFRSGVTYVSSPR
ncbi:hypothetical protein ScPMuIL_017197 [Solemya velum]